MKFRILAGLGAAALLVLLPSYEALAKQQINVVERATTDAVLDLGAKGDSAGDVLTFANKIYDEANKNEIGSDAGCGSGCRNAHELVRLVDPEQATQWESDTPPMPTPSSGPFNSPA